MDKGKTPSHIAKIWQRITRPFSQARSSYQNLASKSHSGGDDDDEDGGPSSGNPKSSRQAGKQAVPSVEAAVFAGDQPHSDNTRQWQAQPAAPAISERLYCTQDCLLGLAYGGPMDEKCPNRELHGQRHLGRQEFLRLMTSQLADERQREANSMSLDLSGARGALFKFCLASDGYTLVGKGMRTCNLDSLLHEMDLYDRLRPIQGKFVPVCLGKVDISIPYRYEVRMYKHILFLSWAGKPLRSCLREMDKKKTAAAAEIALREVHKLGILHRDAEPRNMTYDKANDLLMVVDFDRAVRHEKLPTEEQSCYYVAPRGRDEFDREVDYAANVINNWVH